jgi:Flp pilus assembly protein TadD, contains TPR repeats
MKQFILIITLLISTFSFSQDMQKGFTYLETGKYKAAEVFFKDVLKDYPTNKTARLCYGRAIGLLGKSKQAVSLFTKLLNDYPKDFEVKLNYAESLLWDKQYTNAENFYSKLIVEDTKSFPALLGYANTLSNLKKFEEAMVYVNKALDVLPGNPNALISKKVYALRFG